MRTSGILLPIFSLPSNHGIGTFGKEAYGFVDFLAKSKQSHWQILPIGPTSYGDSPYQSFSTYAGNPYFIDLDLLIDEGLLDKNSLQDMDFGRDPEYVDYHALYRSRYEILRQAYHNGYARFGKDIAKFKIENAYWIEDFSLYMSLKSHFQGRSWMEWDKDIKHREPEALAKYQDLLQEDIAFHTYLQYLFYKQWTDLKQYANEKGIQIIGDIPIYVAEDSADVWRDPHYFQLNEELEPTYVSGCPPDCFSEDGQLWGNPVYNWDAHAEDGYFWWINRIKAASLTYDMVRIDHFRGFSSYWRVPYGDVTARNGEWITGPGLSLFHAIDTALGDLHIIAEDLGLITEDVRRLLDATGYPGMKVLEFAFDPSGISEYLPHNCNKNAVIYTGTHDNDTLKGWYLTLSDEEQRFCQDYTGMNSGEDTWTMIRLLLGSPPNMAIMQLQDLLNLGSEARINVPSTLGTNWKWRMKKGAIPRDLAEQLAHITCTYDRYH